MIRTVPSSVCLLSGFLLTATPLVGPKPAMAQQERGPDSMGTGVNGVLTQVKKLLAADGEERDQFGFSAAISGDTLVVGANLEDEGGTDAGAAYIFERDLGGQDNWGQARKLMASDATAASNFGYSVAIEGDTVVVGARGAPGGGAAYIFERDEGGPSNWGEVARITASDAQPGDLFGNSVGVSSGTLVVGAPGKDTVGFQAGAAFIFERENGTSSWRQLRKILPQDPGDAQWFGSSVAASGDTAVVGAPEEDVAGTYRAGAAHIFSRDLGGSNNWGHVKRIVASDPGTHHQLGWAVAINGDMVVMGSYLVGLPPLDNVGAAYIFYRDHGGPDNWGEVKKVMPSDPEADDYFAWSLAVDIDTLVVGAPEKTNVRGWDGAGYLFERNRGGPDNWGLAQKLLAGDPLEDDNFGSSAAISGDKAIFGAIQVDRAGTGKAYVFGPALIFSDCFESGDTSAWSQAVP